MLREVGNLLGPDDLWLARCHDAISAIAVRLDHLAFPPPPSTMTFRARALRVVDCADWTAHHDRCNPALLAAGGIAKPAGAALGP